MKVLIFGGTGLIGQALMAHPSGEGVEWVVVSRRPAKVQPGSGRQVVSYDEKELLRHFRGVYGLINLAGAGIGDRPWTGSRRRLILESRLTVSKLISSLVAGADDKPRFIVQASAVGFYGSRGDEHLDEHSAPGKGFLPEVVEAWEKALQVDPAIRTLYIRTGLVLSASGGFLGPLLPLYRLFAGGHFGNGKQWMPWIHVEDEVSAIHYLMEHGSASGVFNLVGPNPQRAAAFGRALGRALRRPSWLHIPAFLVRLIPSGFGEELLLTSQYVEPKRLLESGFTFRFPDLGPALNDLFGHG